MSAPSGSIETAYNNFLSALGELAETVAELGPAAAELSVDIPDIVDDSINIGECIASLAGA
jgi:hypothetical protein